MVVRVRSLFVLYAYAFTGDDSHTSQPNSAWKKDCLGLFAGSLSDEHSRTISWIITFSVRQKVHFNVNPDDQLVCSCFGGCSLE